MGGIIEEIIMLEDQIRAAVAITAGKLKSAGLEATLMFAYDVLHYASPSGTRLARLRIVAAELKHFTDGLETQQPHILKRPPGAGSYGISP